MSELFDAAPPRSVLEPLRECTIRILPFVRATSWRRSSGRGRRRRGRRVRRIAAQRRRTRSVALADVFAAAVTNRHVEVEGLLFPETRLRYPPPPRITTAGPVRLRGHDRQRRPPHAARAVRAIWGTASRAAFPPRACPGTRPPARPPTRRRGWQIAGVPIERRYVLIAGMTPSRPGCSCR
ncbi:MAG: hypothetical protein WKF75_10760 [Singulisphaera sp.]